jgi:hypothetical protein
MWFYTTRALKILLIRKIYKKFQLNAKLGYRNF